MAIGTSIQKGMERIRYIIDNSGFIKAQQHCADDRDFQLIYDIQPQGGVKFCDKFVEFGDGYMACLHVYTVPVKLVRHWMFKIFNNPNVIATIDIETLDEQEVKENINRAI